MNFLIMGLPKSGKSALFNVLTKSTRQDLYSDIRIGTVKVPDENLDKVSDWHETEKKVNGEIDITDPATNLNFDSSSDFIEKKYLQEIQKYDGVILLIRSFKNNSVPHPYGEVNLENDIEQFTIESRLIDAQIIEKRIENIKKTFKSLTKQEREASEKNIKCLEEVSELIEQGEPYNSELYTEAHKSVIGSSFLIAKSPMTVILNTDENQSIAEDEMIKIRSLIRKDSTLIQVPLSFEEDMISLEDNEINEFRDASEIASNDFDDIFNNLLKSSSSICFLTAGKKECRSWIIKEGASAVDAAGKIHSDIARGFVRAEVINIEDLLKFSNEKEAKDKGLIRGEGKNYIIKTGDVVNFLFSV